MFITTVKKLKSLSHSHWYWLNYIIGGLSLLAAALYYQYVLDELPCLICIQIRLLISLLVLVACAGLFVRKSRAMAAVANISMVLVALGLSERCYQLLGTERGFVFGDCGFNLGLPAWFAIDEWLPWLYRVETSCGYTPEIVFGITMAETLMFLSACLLLISLSVSLASFFRTSN